MNDDSDDLVQVNFSSPDHSIMKVATSRKTTSVYDKVGELSAIIEEGIRSVSSEPRASVEVDILKMKREAAKGSCPEVEYPIILFRRYADDATTASSQTLTDNMVGPFIDIPEFFYEGTAEQLSGMESTKKNIFWMRAAASLFSLLCCVIMGSVTDISYISLHPNQVILPSCEIVVSEGDFYYDSYKLVIAISSFIFIHSTIFVGYYLLPTDLRGQKYIPGIDVYLEKCFERQHIVNAVSSSAFFCKDYSKLIELIVDACLLFLTLISCVIGAFQVETAEKFVLSANSGTNTGQTYVEFYTIDTFFLSLGETQPQCLGNTNMKSDFIILYACD